MWSWYDHDLQSATAHQVEDGSSCVSILLQIINSFDFLCMEFDVAQLYYKGDIKTNIHQMKVQISVHSFLYVFGGVVQ